MDRADLLAKLRQEYGEIEAYALPGGSELLVIAGPQQPSEYRRLVNQLQSGKHDSAIALENFAVACVIHCGPTEPMDSANAKISARTVFAKYPAFALKVAARAQDLAGAGIEALEGN